MIMVFSLFAQNVKELDMPRQQERDMDEQLMQEWNLSDDNLERWAAVPRIGRKAEVAQELLNRRKGGREGVEERERKQLSPSTEETKEKEDNTKSRTHRASHTSKSDK